MGGGDYTSESTTPGVPRPTAGPVFSSTTDTFGSHTANEHSIMLDQLFDGLRARLSVSRAPDVPLFSPSFGWLSYAPPGRRSFTGSPPIRESR